MEGENKGILIVDLQMKESALPVKYLGVPLISLKLTALDCGGLLEKISMRINSWLAKKFLLLEVTTYFFGAL